MAETRLVFKTMQECDAYEADAALGAALREALALLTEYSDNVFIQLAADGTLRASVNTWRRNLSRESVLNAALLASHPTTGGCGAGRRRHDDAD